MAVNPIPDVELSELLRQHGLLSDLVRRHNSWLGRTNHIRPGWHKKLDGQDGGAWMAPPGRTVVWSIAREQDGHYWLHVSLQGMNNRVPSYEDMVWLHQAFIGDNQVAYQVFAPRAEHVNIHPHVLHLWAPLLGHRPLPDFTRGTGSI